MVFLGAQGMQRFSGPRHRPPRRGIWRAQLTPATKPTARRQAAKAVDRIPLRKKLFSTPRFLVGASADPS